MDIIRISVIGIAGVIVCVMLKQQNSQYWQMASMAAALVILASVTSKIKVIVGAVDELSSYVPVEEKYIAILLKMTGITYVAEFAASICRDSGQQAIAGQIEIFARLSLLLVSLPVVSALIETISRI